MRYSFPGSLFLMPYRSLFLETESVFLMSCLSLFLKTESLFLMSYLSLFLKTESLFLIPCHSLFLETRIEFPVPCRSVLLYRAEAWTVTESMAKRLDGCHGRLLVKARGWTYKDHVPNTTLYKDTPRLSSVLRARRLQFARHCARSNQPVTADLVFW